ncbi:sensor histidine kinase [Clostridium thailandense]|uniref:sensor histidine kinase n=1 Tax=Clostridium thailandense TaxID=2794346 RepID=UPI00398A4183
MKSLKTRLIGSHFIAIFLSIVIIEILCFISIKNYYYNTIEETLKKQAQTSINFFNKYSDKNNKDVFLEDIIETLSYTTNAHIQILSRDKVLVVDSLGIKAGTTLNYPDINAANENKETRFIGVPSYSKEKCMGVSYLLQNATRNSSYIIRLESSLKDVDNFLKNLIIIFIVIGFLVIVFISLISVLISNSIINPLNNIITTAKEMAQGKFSVKAQKKYNDEVGTLADTLNYMAKEILKTDKLKNDFISSVSHELRTPLTAIKGWALTLKRKELIDEIKREEGLNIIIEESERLTALVEELLDFSRFQSNRITLNIEDLNLSELLHNALNEIQPRANRSNIIISSYIPTLPLVKGDKNRLKQVFINILDNSLKFTKSGGSITLKAFLENENVKVSIEDSGIGIEPEHLPHILKKFYKGDTKKSGSGIGLAICEEIIKLHNDSLEIESTLGVGTVVTIILKGA